jgi:threonylcarbamoyladenosine tRNA methylthiotransferase MtaB
MPQLDRTVIKERAARLRAKGDAALSAHLDAQVGHRRRVLTERGGIGRTEQFTAVRLASAVEPGTFLDLTMTGHDGRHLLAA